VKKFHSREIPSRELKDAIVTVNNQGIPRCESLEDLRGLLNLHFSQVQVRDHDELALTEFQAQCRAHSANANPLVQLIPIAARPRAMNGTATDVIRCTAATLPSAISALLAVGLLTPALNLTAALGASITGTPTSQLPLDYLIKEVAPDLNPEDLIGYFNASDLFAV